LRDRRELGCGATIGAVARSGARGLRLPDARRQGIRNIWDAGGAGGGRNAAGIDPNLGKS